jgi:hypothetical protein
MTFELLVGEPSDRTEVRSCGCQPLDDLRAGLGARGAVPVAVTVALASVLHVVGRRVFERA